MVDAPVELDEAALKRSEPDQSALKELFEELEFRTLLRRIAPDASTQTPAKEAPKGGVVQGDLFAMGEAVTEGTDQQALGIAAINYDHLYQLVRTDEEVSVLCRKMMEQPSVCWDTETDSLDEHKAELVGIAFFLESRNSLLWPFRRNVPCSSRGWSCSAPSLRMRPSKRSVRT